MVDALILTGTGRYSDPWHAYSETSPLLAELARAAGFSPRIETGADGALRRLDDGVRLLVINAGDPEGPDSVDPTGTRTPATEPEEPVASLAEGDAALASALDRGIGILAMHSAAASLRDYPSYERALGGRWVRGRSWHPDFGEAHVRLDPEHPLAAGLRDFAVDDERYTDLRLDAEIDRLASHEHDGLPYPLVWTRDLGRSRVVYDALGHDPRSYASAGHRELLARALRWLREV
ncbi:ThuA domain-containing protein [Microbacterium sp. TPD7012]|uniref:ThuA domain-containing protein n=1 Tax=Microbacterium sp. TPD7012 TaxID=2171975 RepID=UPI000D5129C3|nr:ThuA domain-containing protein [Microbacterium sp. TPD7012]PVE94656.1 ThuA domain-containing protein [Microbacterium sp. TPD7012]